MKIDSARVFQRDHFYNSVLCFADCSYWWGHWLLQRSKFHWEQTNICKSFTDTQSITKWLVDGILSVVSLHSGFSIQWYLLFEVCKVAVQHYMYSFRCCRRDIKWSICSDTCTSGNHASHHTVECKYTARASVRGRRGNLLCLQEYFISLKGF